MPRLVDMSCVNRVAASLPTHNTPLSNVAEYDYHTLPSLRPTIILPSLSPITPLMHTNNNNNIKARHKACHDEAIPRRVLCICKDTDEFYNRVVMTILGAAVRSE